MFSYWFLFTYSGYCNDYYIHRIIVQDISETNADLEELVKIQISQVSQLVQPQERKFDELISSLSFLSSKASLLFGKIETVGYGLTMVSKALPGSEGGANESSTQSTPPGSTTPWLSQTTLTGSQGFESSTVWTPQSNATLQAPQSTVSGNPEQTSTPHSNETEGSGYAKRQKRGNLPYVFVDENLKVNGYHWWIFYHFCAFLFAVLHTNALLERGLNWKRKNERALQKGSTLKENNWLPRGTNSFLFELTFFQKEDIAILKLCI